MDLLVGQQYRTRAGAVVEVVGRIDTGLMRYSSDWKPLGHAHLIKCRIVRCADGTRLIDRECGYAVHDDGSYYADREHGLDLVRLVSARVAA